MTAYIPDWISAKFVIIGLSCIAGVRLLKLGLRRLMMYLMYKDIDRVPENYEQDLVYVHTFPRTLFKSIVSISPFGLKLETWLRLNKIKHQIMETRIFSKSTNQIPYIFLNGSEIADSTLIIEHLNDVFELDSTEGLTREQQGARQAFVTMMDDHFSWTVFLPRYVYQPELFIKLVKFTPYSWINKRITKGMEKRILQRAQMAGIGRKPADTVAHLGNNDVRAISQYLGQKKYMMGEKMTMVDCCIFGHLAQIIYCDFPYKHKDLLNGECSNLMPYMERIKETIWPDWDEIVAKASAALSA